MTFNLSKRQKDELEYLVIPEDVRLRLLRFFRARLSHDRGIVEYTWKAQVVNIARNNLGLSVFTPTFNAYEDDYNANEYAWISSEFELAFRRPSTTDLVYIIADLILEGAIRISDTNEIFETNDIPVSFLKPSEEKVEVEIFEGAKSDELEEDEHPNVRTLIQRMENCLEEGDFGGVVHAAASALETLAKDVIDRDTIEDQTLASFFECYVNESRLPESFLNYVDELYQERNTQPLAGHGQTETPDVNREEATVISEVTKTLIRIERRLARPVAEIESTG